MAASDPTSEANLQKMSIDDLMAFAKVVEEAERYKDMIKISSCTIRKAYAEVPPTEEELKKKDDAEGTGSLEKYKQAVKDRRNHVSVAYKNVVGNQRNAWRMTRDKGDEDIKELKDKYQGYLRQVITCVCNKVIQLICTSPLRGYQLKDAANKVKATYCFNVEDTVFWLKMVGDYCRYLAELDKDADTNVGVILNHMYKAASEKESDAAKKEEMEKMSKNTAAKWAKAYYEAAVELCKVDPAKKHKGLEVTHPIRLGLALNFSVCFYECLGESKKAIDMARNAFDHAIEKLDTLNDESYKDSTLIMQLLRDNMTLWMQEQESNGQDEQDEQ